MMDLEKMTRERLSQMCKAVGLRPKGTKGELIARLKEHQGLLKDLEDAEEEGS